MLKECILVLYIWNTGAFPNCIDAYTNFAKLLKNENDHNNYKSNLILCFVNYVNLMKIYSLNFCF